MGTFLKGILGGFSGRIGTVIGANWRGLDVMRSRPRKSNRAATEEQLQQRLKFGLVSKFLAPISPLLRLKYGQPEEAKSRRNLAVSYHVLEAVTGTYPDYAINYPLVIITKGELAGFQAPEAVAAPGSTIAFTWVDNTGLALAYADDQMVAVVYNAARKEFKHEQTALRSEAGYNFSLPANWAAEKVHCWISFTSANGKMQSNSIYMGELTLL